MKAIAVSDLHIGYELSNTKLFARFLNVISAWDVDHLLLVGDIIEIWRRDMLGVLLQYSEIFTKLKELAESINVVCVAGNHDWHTLNIGKVIEYPKPFDNFVEEFKIDVGDFYYRFVHGHQFDAKCSNNEVNEGMCHSNDEQGKEMSDTWNNIGSASMLFYTPLHKISIPPPYIGVLAYVAKPGILGETPDELEIFRETALRNKDPKEFLLYGHTHNAMLDKEKMVADSGCWVGSCADYILIEDETISLNSFK